MLQQYRAAIPDNCAIWFRWHAALVQEPDHPWHPGGFNGLHQYPKAKARGYHTHKNFINMAYLILGKLDLRLAT